MTKDKSNSVGLKEMSIVSDTVNTIADVSLSSETNSTKVYNKRSNIRSEYRVKRYSGKCMKVFKRNIKITNR